MKKMYLKMVFIVFSGFLAFGHPNDQNEINFLLFAPNSGDRFANETQAIQQLDDLAVYLKGRDIAPGKIHVHGYAAAAKNDIDPMNLSRDRALFVISELQNRGLARDLFSAPVAHGEVNLWGSNITEEDKTPNRRVIILLDDFYLAAAAPITGAGAAHDSRAQFFWILLILLLFLLGIALIAAHIFFASKHKKKILTAPPQSSGALTPRRESGSGTFNEQEQTKAYKPIAAQKEEPRIVIVNTVPAVLAAIPAAASDRTGAASQKNAGINADKYMPLEKALREIIFLIPLGTFFDVHTIVELLLQKHDSVYLMNVGRYTSAAMYHSRISALIGHEVDLVDKAGNSYSKNIHAKFSECHIFRRKM